MSTAINISKCTRKEYTCFQHNNKEYWAEKVITHNGVVTDIYELPNYDDLYTDKTDKSLDKCISEFIQTLDNIEKICQ